MKLICRVTYAKLKFHHRVAGYMRELLLVVFYNWNIGRCCWVPSVNGHWIAEFDWKIKQKRLPLILRNTILLFSSERSTKTFSCINASTSVGRIWHSERKLVKTSSLLLHFKIDVFHVCSRLRISSVIELLITKSFHRILQISLYLRLFV